MNEELRAARERLVTGSHESETQYWNDCRKLASACLGDHQADDDELVMPEWLESLGYHDSMGMSYEKRYELCNGIRIVFLARQHPQRWAAEIWVGGGRCHVKQNPTRGDVRRLLAALGIEVKS